jgi:hypothetical protein
MSGSSIGTIAGGLIGGILGFFVPVIGTAIGFSLGATLGGAIGGFIDAPKKPEIVGPRLTDLTIQTSTYGAFIPRVYGKIAVFGNIFWIQNNQITEVAKKVSQGGKGIGGGGATTKTYSYYGTFALGLCEGPIIEILRIWIGNQLFYDATSINADIIKQSNINAQYFKLYTGTENQLPDPIIQASLGAANVPAYRGLAYLVFYSLPLKDYGNSLQSTQIKVEIVKEGTLSNHLISDFDIPENSTWGSSAAKCAGNQMDSSGLSNFVVVQNSFPLWLQVSGGAIVQQTKLIASIYPATFAAQPLTTSLDTLQYAFTSINDYFAWGKNGTIDTLLIAGSTPLVFAEKQGVIFITWDLGATRFLAKLDNGLIVAQVSIYPDNPCVAVWGNLAVTAYAALSGNPITIKIYEEISGSLSLYDSYSIILDLSDYTKITGINNSCYVHDDKLFIVTNAVAGIGQFVKIIVIDLFLKSLIIVHDIDESFSNITISEFPNVRVVDNTVWYGQRIVGVPSVGFVHNGWQIDRITPSDIPLSEIIEDECLQSNFLTVSDVDVTELTDIVRGYRVSELAAIRGGIDPLRTAWPFDAIQSGYQIYFKRRGSASIATIDLSLLDARPAGSQNGVIISQSREMDAALPRKVLVKYFDVTREYDVNEQYMERINTDAVNELELNLPIVLNADEAAQKAETLLYLYWLERNDLLFKLPPIYANLEPGDVITINGDNADYEARLTAIDYTADNRLECKAKYNRSIIYTTFTQGEEGQSTGVTLSLTGPSNYELLDIPMLQSVYDKPGFPVAMSGYLDGWPGGVIYRSKDNGQSWLDMQGFESPGSTIGYANTSLPIHGGTVLDKTNRLTIILSSGTLSSITEQQMFQGQNWFVYGLNGKWEIIAAQNCVLQGDGTYILSDFLRGQMGTEWATGLHAINDRIILLNSDELEFLTMDSSDITVEYLYRGITLGKDIDSDSDRAFSYDAVNLECLSPVHLSGNRHPTTNNWTITWVRRTRFAGWRDFIDAELGEDTESYDIEIYSNSSFTTLKRTLTSTTQSVAYTSAQQVTDFGSNQSTLHLKIYQNSAIVGRGYTLQQSITRT